MHDDEDHYDGDGHDTDDFDGSKYGCVLHDQLAVGRACLLSS